MRKANWWIAQDGYHECGDCDTYYADHDSLIDHLENSQDHIYCTDCDLEFDSWNARRSHWANSSRHAFCTLCSSHLYSRAELDEHYNDEHWPCRVCPDIFASQNGQYEHERQAHPFCSVHRIPFHTQANLNAHLASSQHVVASVKCRAGCGRVFVDTAAMVLHLEAGTCTSGMTRQRLDTFVRNNDHHNVITNPRRMITGPAPSAQSTIKLTATNRAWNPDTQFFECPLCNRDFRTLDTLNRHLASPRHADAVEMGGTGEKMYRCPMQSCAKQFSTLSGLVAHMERGSCNVLQLHAAQASFNGLMNGMRSITY